MMYRSGIVLASLWVSGHSIASILSTLPAALRTWVPGNPNASYHDPGFAGSIVILCFAMAAWTIVNAVIAGNLFSPRQRPGS